MRQKLIPFITDAGERWDNYYEDPVTQIIYFKKGHAGRKVKFSTGYKRTESVSAKREANKKFNELIKGKRQVRTLIKDELALWLVVKEKEGHAYDTMNNVRRAKRQIEEFWGGKFPSEITRDALAEWYTWWANKYPSIDMENAVKYMRNFCGYLAQKVVDNQPLLPAVPDIADPNYKTIRRRRKKKKERILTSAEFKIISDKAACLEDQFTVLFMYTMASRITETLSLRLGIEIKLDTSPPQYRWSDGQNKAGLDGWHALHPATIEPLRRIAAIRATEGTNRVYPQQGDKSKPMREQMIDWGAWRTRANLGWHWTPHTFRHTCLSNLANNPKVPQSLICKLYRVSLAVLLETYAHVTPEGREIMREAIEVQL